MSVSSYVCVHIPPCKDTLPWRGPISEPPCLTWHLCSDLSEAGGTDIGVRTQTRLWGRSATQPEHLRARSCVGQACFPAPGRSSQDCGCQLPRRHGGGVGPAPRATCGPALRSRSSRTAFPLGSHGCLSEEREAVLVQGLVGTSRLPEIHLAQRPWGTWHLCAGHLWSPCSPWPLMPVHP